MRYPSQARFLPKLLHRLGLHSLRSRYIAATTVGSITLLLAASSGWRYVETITANQLSNVSHRADASDAMSNTVLQTHSLETRFYRFISLPSEESRQQIQQGFRLHASAIENLRENPWIQQDPVLLELVTALQQDHLELSREVENLIEVRSDEKKWFPVMATMQETMLNQNLQFMSSLDLMTQEIGQHLDDPVQLENYKLLNEIRHYWQLMIGEFRLFIANNFGVFSSDPQRGMSTRKANIELYQARIKELLGQLSRHGENAPPDLVSQASLLEMRHWLVQWTRSYRQVVDTLNAGQWRHDLLLLQDRVEPVLNRIRQRTTGLQSGLSVASAKDITRLTQVARNFSDFVIYLAVSLVLAGLLGFFLLYRTILRPISDVAQALKDEASGRQKVNVPLSSATEIRNLTDAFAAMREQIRTREAHLDHMAHHDALTQLPNRMLFQFRLEHAISQAIRNKTRVGLMFLDLDRFKQINDSLGHDIGDQLLRYVAKRLTHCLRSSDTVARLGGDEFAIILENMSQQEQVAATARKILNEFKAPFNVGTGEIHSSTSIGIAFAPDDADTAEALTKQADIAMYHAKSIGRNTFKFYAPQMSSEVVQKVALESELRHAIENHELVMHYQPIVDLRSGRIISTEALLRWQHPERGLLGPDEFLPALIDSGLIKPVTQWVLIEAGKQYLAYQAAGQPAVRVCVNLCGFVFRNDSVLDIVVTALEHAQTDPRGLIVEVTEDTLLEDLYGAQQSLQALQQMGIRIALDDFGTGHSSLNHLRHSPIDIIKIDRDFIQTVPANSNDSDLVDAIIAMAHKLHIKVVAEGVENKQQLDFLHWHKCDAIQGFLFSPAVPAGQLLEMLNQDRRMLG